MRNTTKIFAMLILIALTVTALASCGIMIPGEYRFGLATVETDDSQIAAAVILDSSDRIALVRIDEIQNGKTSSKGDLGASYGMVAYGGAIAEWNEQIAHLERTLIGKTMDEALALTSDDADIASGCTVYIGNYLTAVGNACAKAKDAEAFSSTVDHLALTLNIIAGKAGEDGALTVAVAAAALSRGYIMAKDAKFLGAVPSDHKLGLATVDTEDGKVAAAVVIDENGRIVDVKIDEIANGETESKKEKGDAYGMLTNSPYYGSSLAEWDDQIAHLESTLIGKNAEQVGIVSGDDADIVTGCTVYIGNYTQAVLKAMDNAKTSSTFNAISDTIDIELAFGIGEDGEFTVNAKALVKGSKVAEKNNNSADFRFGFATIKTADGKVVAAVVIDSANRVALVKIDEIANGETESKKEKGDAYGMLTNSPYYGSSLAEWDDQIAHLENSLIGKTSEEIAGIAADDADITAGCTVYIGNYTQAVINAIANANESEVFTAVKSEVEISVEFEVDTDGEFVVNATVTAGGETVGEANDGAISEALRFAYVSLPTADGMVGAAVVINSDNRVVLVKIDEIANGETESKKEKGDAYGMLSAWGSQLAEWDDQIAHLENSLIGKTAEEIAGIAADDADITAGCTVYIGNYTQAVINAITAAKSAESFDAIPKKVEISLSFTVSGDSFTVNASVDPGNTEELRFAYVSLSTTDGMVGAAVIINADNKVVAVKIDEIANGETQSKKEKGDSYGMLGSYGSSLAEWDDQIAHLEASLIGLTAEEIAGIAADDADITAGCTIYIGNYKQAVIDAITLAKSAESFEAVVKKLDISLSFNLLGEGFTVNASTTTKN